MTDRETLADALRDAIQTAEGDPAVLRAAARRLLYTYAAPLRAESVLLEDMQPA